MLSEYKESDPRRLAEIITGDETWIRYDEPLSKERNKVWVVKGEVPPLNPRPDFRDQEVRYSIFFDAHGPVAEIIIPKEGRQLLGTFMPTVASQKWKNITGSGGQSLERGACDYYTICMST
ncbi:Transposase [Oopsacas minuta]|uniref:Transposase n=1 Tax=Oopsacas minuta TaxID=111878 RepID=A0AAV7KLE2_9METZ|nr:Transposase [Oopsacas minuta]